MNVNLTTELFCNIIHLKLPKSVLKGKDWFQVVEFKVCVFATSLELDLESDHRMMRAMRAVTAVLRLQAIDPDPLICVRCPEDCWQPC